VITVKQIEELLGKMRKRRSEMDLNNVSFRLDPNCYEAIYIEGEVDGFDICYNMLKAFVEQEEANG
jgi:hypothetical protein